MSDPLLQLSRHALTRALLRGAGLPAVPVLTRAATPYGAQPLAGLGAAHGAVRATALGASAMAALRDAGVVEAGAPSLLLYDATALGAVADLRRLYEFFNAQLPRRAGPARVVLLARSPEHADDVDVAAARRAVDGFTRSLARELGRHGGTANRLLVDDDAATGRLAAPLHFLLSPRAAYVSGQTLRIDTAVRAPAEQPRVQPLAGRVALVTGAAHGLGAAIARRLHGEGAHVVCVDLPAESASLQALATSLEGTPLPCDLTRDGAPADIRDGLRRRHGGVDIVVHNAGVTRDKTLARMDASRWDACLAVNLEAILRIDRALLDGGLLRDGGRLLCLSSIAGIAGNVGQTNYAAAKAGVIGYVAARARQLAARGVTANAIAPGLIETRMMQAMPFVFREAARRMNSLRQGGVPLDVAEAVTFLATPGACGVTGQVLRVCGQSLIGA